MAGRVRIHPTAFAQAAPRTGRGGGPQTPQVVSPELSPDGKLTFRILAPKAESVQLGSSDIPGIGFGQGKFPIFYLLHGAFDCDESWSAVGRAGLILDNLIAAGKAKPMVVVMPHGHTGPFRFGTPFNDEFEREFVTDIMPQMEKRYRVRTDRKHRAMAGLSMSGAHTLNLGISHLEKFAYLGVYSSGIFGIAGGPGGNQPQGPTFEEKHKAILDDARLKKGLKLFWFATGKDDFLLETSRATVAMFKKHQFAMTYKETDGAHTWIVWREYLHEFAQQLFQ